MPELIRVERTESGVARLSLNSGSGNPLTPAALDALALAIDGLYADLPTALVIDGGEGKLFSGGFDVPTVADYDREQLKAFFGPFLRSCSRIILFPKPTVCGIHSTAIAGGFILSLATDFRVVAKGRLKLGLSEADLGIAVPAGTQQLLSERVGGQAARRMSYTGQLIGPEEAYRLGYADVLADDAQAEAMAMAQMLAAKPGDGVNVGRSFQNIDIEARFSAAEDRFNEAFLDSWLSPAANRCLKGLAAKLTGKLTRKR